MQIKDAVVAITGGAGGLGFAAAERLGSLGAKIALIDLSEEGLQKAAETLKAEGIEVGIYAGDIASEDDVVGIFEKIVDDFGSLQGLINSAGIIRDGSLLKIRDGDVVDRMSLAQFNSVIAVNLTGTFLCGREAAAHMVKSGKGGCIVNISSIAAAGNRGQSNYSAAKAGVEALAVTWSKELAHHGIRTACVAPGFVDTGMLGDMKQEVLDKFTKTIPVGRLAKPIEMAKTIEFIFDNDSVSGRTFAIDGGLRL